VHLTTKKGLGQRLTRPKRGSGAEGGGGAFCGEKRVEPTRRIQQKKPDLGEAATPIWRRKKRSE